jgi:hypothetical protein
MNILLLILDVYLAYTFYTWSNEFQKQDKNILSLISFFVSTYFGAMILTRIL